MKLIHKFNIQKIFSASILFLLVSCSTDEKQTVTILKKLVIQDEFDVAGAPNTALWNYSIGTGTNGWGNNELQYYTDRSQNIKIPIDRTESLKDGITMIKFLEEGRQFGKIVLEP